MVPGAAFGMDGGAGHERESGRDFEDNDSGGYAGKSIFLQEYAAVFHHTDRFLSGRIFGGPYMGAAHGRRAGKIVVNPAVWNRKRFRRRGYDVCDRSGRCGRMRDIRQDSEKISVSGTMTGRIYLEHK